MLAPFLPTVPFVTILAMINRPLTLGLNAKYLTTARGDPPWVSSTCEPRVAHNCPEEKVAEEMVNRPGSKSGTGSPIEAPRGWKPFFCCAGNTGKWNAWVCTATAFKSKFGVVESRELVLVNAQIAKLCSV